MAFFPSSSLSRINTVVLHVGPPPGRSPCQSRDRKHLSAEMQSLLICSSGVMATERETQRRAEGRPTRTATGMQRLSLSRSAKADLCATDTCQLSAGKSALSNGCYKSFTYSSVEDMVAINQGVQTAGVKAGTECVLSCPLG